MDHQPAASRLDYGIIDPAEARMLTGYELIKRIRDGAFPAPPIAKLFNFQLTEVDPGRAVFTGQPSIDFYNPIGSVHGGFAATLLDSCMGCAIHSSLAAGIGYTTLEIKVSFLRPILENTGPLRAEGKIISVGKRVGTAEGRIVDAEGKLYAHGTTTCLIFPLS